MSRRPRIGAGYAECVDSIKNRAAIRLGSDNGSDGGVVLLGRIKIAVPDDLTEPVAREPLIEQVGKTFALLTEEHVRNLAKISGTR